MLLLTTSLLLENLELCTFDAARVDKQGYPACAGAFASEVTLAVLCRCLCELGPFSGDLYKGFEAFVLHVGGGADF